MSHPNSKLSFEDRFWLKVGKQNNNECWNWLGAIITSGYGELHHTIMNKSKVAHRISYELHFGEIPDGLCCLHTCDNRRCVNPNHLYLGTHSDNMHDMVMKNRHVFVPFANGINNPSNKLTEQHVKEIRFKYRNSVISQIELAKQYSINQSTVWEIVHNKIWRSLDD